MAQNNEYKVPKSSISYFVEDTNNDQVEIVSPPAKVAKENSTPTKAKSSDYITAEPIKQEKEAPKPYISEKKVAKQKNKKENFELSWKENKSNVKSTKTAANKSARAVKKAKKHTALKRKIQKTPAVKTNYKKTAKKKAKKHIAATATARQSIMVKTAEEEPVFSQALKKMQQRAAERRAEAEKLGIVLPSQGGDMASVSPALSKINQTVKTILSRNP